MKINGMTFINILLAGTLALASLAAQASGKFTYYAVDANGSRVVAMDESGAVIWRKTYAPYGKTSGNDRDNRIGYTGHVENANGLVDAGARHYDPELGIFTSDDPVRFTESNPASFNRYAYANNNPYKYVDPDGNTPETIWDAANVAMGVASFTANMAGGNYLGAAVDAAGVVVDAAATITPIVPGGAGAAIKAARGAEKVADVARGGRNLPFKDADRLTEANKTLDRIESGGPFPHKQDGTVFRNKEGKLPEGNYREYTVDTPGASSRGARRVVQDADSGRAYYTDDHYDNFIQVDPTKR